MPRFEDCLIGLHSLRILRPLIGPQEAVLEYNPQSPSICATGRCIRGLIDFFMVPDYITRGLILLIALRENFFCPPEDREDREEILE